MNVSVESARREGYFLSVETAGRETSIHSRYAPRREAERWADELAKLADRIVLFGAGLGYLPQALQERSVEYFVLEPLSEFSVPDDLPLRELQSRSRFVRYSPSEPIRRTIDRIPLKYLAGAQPNIHPGYQAIYPNLDEVVEAFLTEGMGVLRGVESRYNFFHTWFDNLLGFLPELPKMCSANTLRDQYRDQPGVLIGAGPSLDESYGFLREHQNQLLIVAVDTALYPLEQNGIQPDLVVTVDPQEENLRYLDGVEFDSGLVTSLTARPRYYRRAGDQPAFPFYISSNTTGKSMFPLLDDILPFLDGLITLPAAGSVSTTGLGLLKFLECDPIFNLGVDHAYTFHRATVRSSHWAEDQLGKLSRFQTLAGAHLGKIISSNRENNRVLKSITTREGNSCLTTDEYLSQNRWFEDQARSYSGRCIDLRKDGAPMETWNPRRPEQITESLGDHVVPPLDESREARVRVDWDGLNRWADRVIPRVENISRQEIREMVESRNMSGEGPGELLRPLVQYLRTQDLDDRDQLISEYLETTREKLSELKAVVEASGH